MLTVLERQVSMRVQIIMRSVLRSKQVVSFDMHIKEVVSFDTHTHTKI